MDADLHAQVAFIEFLAALLAELAFSRLQTLGAHFSLQGDEIDPVVGHLSLLGNLLSRGILDLSTLTVVLLLGIVLIVCVLIVSLRLACRIAFVPFSTRLVLILMIVRGALWVICHHSREWLKLADELLVIIAHLLRQYLDVIVLGSFLTHLRQNDFILVIYDQPGC